MSNKLRRHIRQEFASRVWLTWDGGGALEQAACRGLDISSSGMRVASMDPIPAGTLVNFRIQGTMFAGAGSIRSCSHERMRYAIGVEFSQSVRWDPVKYPIAASMSTASMPAYQPAVEPEKTEEATRAVEQ